MTSWTSAAPGLPCSTSTFTLVGRILTNAESNPHDRDEIDHVFVLPRRNLSVYVELSGEGASPRTKSHGGTVVDRESEGGVVERNLDGSGEGICRFDGQVPAVVGGVLEHLPEWDIEQ